MFWRAAGTGGAVSTVLCLLEEWVSLSCLSAYEEMGTEEPALKTSLVVSELLGEEPSIPSMLSCRTALLGE